MAEILLYGIIGDPFDKLDAKTVAGAIRAASGPLSIRINSPGGYVMEGLAIVAAMRDYRSKITVYVDGIAASMGSVIAAAADDVIMAEASMIMVHKPWDSAIGDAEELRRSADQLDKIEEQIIGIYAKRTGLGGDELAAMLAAETWLTADEALELGFATSIAPDLQIAALADLSACGFHRVPLHLTKQDPDMTDTAQALATERTRVTAIMNLCEKHNLGATLAREMIDKGTAVDAAREIILDRLATRGDALGIGHSSGHITLDNPETFSAAVMGALVAKIGGTAAEGPATEFRGMTVVDIARDVLARAGERDVHRISADRVINMAMGSLNSRPRFGATARNAITQGTNDFPDLVGGAAEKFLVDRYKLLQTQLKKLAARRDYSDFLTHYGVQVDDWGALDTVPENAEFKQRPLNTRKNGYQISTFGNLFAVSRQMLVNDSLGALADILNIMAAGAAETEATLLAALINANTPYSDGTAFFHANHGNLAASGALPTIASLDASRQAMRTQKNAEGRIIDASPKFLLVPAQLQTSAETLVASTIAPATTADVNPFSGKLEPLADPRLASATNWYLFCDPALSPAMQYSYLDGQEAPFTESKDGWNVDGTEFKVRHDFGAGWTDYRFAYKNPGA